MGRPPVLQWGMIQAHFTTSASLLTLLREPSKDLLPSHSPQAQGTLWCSELTHRPHGLSKKFSGSPAGLTVSGLHPPASSMLSLIPTLEAGLAPVSGLCHSLRVSALAKVPPSQGLDDLPSLWSRDLQGISQPRGPVQNEYAVPLLESF